MIPHTGTKGVDGTTDDEEIFLLVEHRRGSVALHYGHRGAGRSDLQGLADHKDVDLPVMPSDRGNPRSGRGQPALNHGADLVRNHTHHVAGVPARDQSADARADGPEEDILLTRVGNRHPLHGRSLARGCRKMKREAHGGVESRGVDGDLGAIRGELGSARHCDTAVAEIDRTVVDGEFEQRNGKSQIIVVRHLVVDARQCDAVADVHPNQQMLILDLVGDFRTQLLSSLTLFANTENELVTHEPVL